jgi:hypothetical protein
MPTSIRLPPKLLRAANARAKALGISRNRLILQAIERELRESSAWSEGFFEALVDVDDSTRSAVDELTTAITKGRRSKEPVRF